MFIFVALVSLVTALYEDDNSSVVLLDGDTFDKQINGKKELWLVQFFNSNESKSKKFEKEWERIAKAYKNIVTVAAVDYEDAEEITETYNVQKYPEIQFFTKGEASVYEGDLKAQNITHFVTEQLTEYTYKSLKKKKPKAKKDTVWGEGGIVYTFNSGNFEFGIVNNDNFWVVLFYTPQCGEQCDNLQEEFDEAADLQQTKGRIYFAKIDCFSGKDVAEKYGVTTYPTILMFPSYDKGHPVDYSVGVSAGEIADRATDLFVELGQLPELNMLKDYDDLRTECLMPKRPCVLAVLDDDEDFEKMVQKAKLVQKQLKGKKSNYVAVNYGESDEIEEMFGIEDERQIIGIDPKELEYTYMTSVLNESNIASFAKKFMKKKDKVKFVLPKEEL